jgi:hypothetical protein
MFAILYSRRKSVVGALVSSLLLMTSVDSFAAGREDAAQLLRRLFTTTRQITEELAEQHSVMKQIASGTNKAKSQVLEERIIAALRITAYKRPRMVEDTLSAICLEVLKNPFYRENPEKIDPNRLFMRAQKLEDVPYCVPGTSSVKLVPLTAAIEAGLIGVRDSQLREVRETIEEVLRTWEGNPEAAGYVLAAAACNVSRRGDRTGKVQRMEEFLETFRNVHPEAVDEAKAILADKSIPPAKIRVRAFLERSKLEDQMNGALLAVALGTFGVVALGSPAEAASVDINAVFEESDRAEHYALQRRPEQLRSQQD